MFTFVIFCYEGFLIFASIIIKLSHPAKNSRKWTRGEDTSAAVIYQDDSSKWRKEGRNKFHAFHT